MALSQNAITTLKRLAALKQTLKTAHQNLAQANHNVLLAAHHYSQTATTAAANELEHSVEAVATAQATYDAEMANQETKDALAEATAERAAKAAAAAAEQGASAQSAVVVAPLSPVSAALEVLEAAEAHTNPIAGASVHAQLAAYIAETGNTSLQIRLQRVNVVTTSLQNAQTNHVTAVHNVESAAGTADQRWHAAAARQLEAALAALTRAQGTYNEMMSHPETQQALEAKAEEEAAKAEEEAAAKAAEEAQAKAAEEEAAAKAAEESKAKAAQSSESGETTAADEDLPDAEENWEATHSTVTYSVPEESDNETDAEEDRDATGYDSEEPESPPHGGILTHLAQLLGLQ